MLKQSEKKYSKCQTQYGALSEFVFMVGAPIRQHSQLIYMMHCTFIKSTNNLCCGKTFLQYTSLKGRLM